MIEPQKQTQEYSDDPVDYGMTRFSDLEIADHSIMIEGLPKDIPREVLEEKLLALFKSLSKGCLPS